MLFFFEVQCNESKFRYSVGSVVVFTTVAANATQSISPVDVTLIMPDIFKAGNSSLYSKLASISPRKGDRSVGLTHRFCLRPLRCQQYEVSGTTG